MAVRKRTTKLTAAERQRYVDVMTTLINNGKYGQMVKYHSRMSHMMHSSMGSVGRQRFLSWHRDYLLKIEQLMQQVDPLAFVPYWDWTVERKIPTVVKNFKPTVSVPGFPTITIKRVDGPPPPLPTKAHVKDVLSETTFTDFTTQLELVHNDVHGWVGGIMNDIQRSPSDPIFWIHHAQVDRLWSIWQAKANNAGKGPTLSGNERILDPWSETAAQMSSISTLGYSYGS